MASANTLICDLVTPVQFLFTGLVVQVRAPAANGDIGLLHLRAPLISTLKRGLVRIKQQDDTTLVFAINGGYLEVDGEKVIILASRAINLNKINSAISLERIARHEETLANLDDDNPAKAYALAEISWQNYLLTLAEQE